MTKNTEYKNLPNRDEAHDMLIENVKDTYQLHHSKMVAIALEAYAEKYNENKDLWYITGLLHDIDYYKYPEEHPNKATELFEELDFPTELIHAVKSHYWQKTNELPQTRLASILIATDELAGFLYAYSLMRPNGFEGMEEKSVRKKFKDKTFAAKVNRDDILFGVEKSGLDLSEHITFLIDVYSKLK